MTAKNLVALIDKYSADNQENPLKRKHLGPSQIGSKCLRQIWYSFRKAKLVKHTGRIVRLFNRGHLEEYRFNEYLRGIGLQVTSSEKRLVLKDDVLIEVEREQEFEGVDVSGDIQQEALARAFFGLPRRQVGFIGYKGHYRGSCDGIASDPDGILKEVAPMSVGSPGLIEEKTHNDKSFKLLVSKGLQTSKLNHYIQMQVYMNQLGLKWGLYLAVNKNDDELYSEFVVSRPEIAEPYNERAASIIDAERPPARYSVDPSWFECKFCDYREICHYGEAMRPSCRTCAYGQAAEGGEWRCRLYEQIIPADFEMIGCDKYEAIRE